MIITALGNEEINSKLKQIYKENIYLYDISTKENMIEFLEKNKEKENIEFQEELTIITKSNLFGEIDDNIYISKIRKLYPYSKIIYIIDKLSDEYKTFLFSNDIFDIIEGNIISIEKITELIKSDKKIIYKESDSISNLQVKEAAIQYENESIVIPKELFAIYGTSGSGKSLFSTLLAKKLSAKLNINVALLDLDIQNPSIDILVNSSGDSNLLSHIVEDVDKRNEISDIISKYMVRDKENKNLHYMTNNVSLFECQNKLSDKYYQKIYSSVGQKYDYSIIDLPSSPFLDVVSYTLINATKIFFVINANYVSIRQAIKYLDLITKLWNVSKDRIAIVINKVKKNSLDISQIQNLMPEYNIVCDINYDENLEAYVNGMISDIKLDINVDKIFNWLNIYKKNKKIENFKSNILRKWGL